MDQEQRPGMRRFETIILGAGPAGTGPLVAAAKSGSHERWLARGVAWADSRPRMGAGSLSRYAISSDTMAQVLLEGLTGERNPLSRLGDDPVVRTIAARGSDSLALSLAARLYDRLGAHLQRLVRAAPQSAFLPLHRAVSMTRASDGVFHVGFANGRTETAATVVFAMGGYQDRPRILATEVTPGISFAAAEPGRIAFTDHLFAHGGMVGVQRRLESLGRPPRVVIVGGSHSAMTTAVLLLQADVARRMGPGSITILCRRVPRVFYPSVAAATADGYHDFTAADVCPLTGRVYRLAGLRMDGRTLLQHVLAVGGRPREDRVHLQVIEPTMSGAIRGLLQEADLVVPALGYRPSTVPLVDVREGPIAFAAGTSRHPLVDSRCRVLDVNGRAVPGVYAIGLASGFVPRGRLGGEPSFRGQSNGLWLYQHDTGQRLLEELTATALSR